MASLKFTMLGRAALGPTFTPKARIAMRGVHMSAQANSTLSKQELVDIVSTQSGVKKDSVKSVVESLTQAIVNAVAQGDLIVIKIF
jgi:Bacterial DNA-binding protein